jgi:hypothetical protein
MNSSIFVMPGLVPGIHVLQRNSERSADGWDRPGHDETHRQWDGL